MSNIPVWWIIGRSKALMAEWEKISRQLGNEPHINFSSGLHGAFFSLPYRNRWEKGQRAPLKRNIQSLRCRMVRKNLWCNKEGRERKV